MTPKHNLPDDLTDEDKALFKALRLTWPNWLSHELDGAGDRQWQEHGKRLLDAKIISRIEHTGLVEDQVVKAGSYRLHDDYAKRWDATSDPSLT